MRTRKLATRGAIAALIGASAMLVAASPASARLICNQYGSCYWTHNPGDYVPTRYENRQYEQQWNVRIHGAHHHGYWNMRGDRDWDRDRYDRDRDYDYDRY